MLWGADELPHARARSRVSGAQALQARWVARDPIDQPERRRGRGDIAEQRLLIAESTKVAQAVPAVGEHHRQITNHAALIVPGASLLEL